MVARVVWLASQSIPGSNRSHHDERRQCRPCPQSRSRPRDRLQRRGLHEGRFQLRRGVRHSGGRRSGTLVQRLEVGRTSGLGRASAGWISSTAIGCHSIAARGHPGPCAPGADRGTVGRWRSIAAQSFNMASRKLRKLIKSAKVVTCTASWSLPFADPAWVFWVTDSSQRLVF